MSIETRSPRGAPARAGTGGLPPAWRVPLLVLGFASLLAGTTGALVRLGWPMPAAAASVAGLHGPLMICGFFGVVISLERAVAIGRGWAYLGPAFAGAGGIAALAGALPQAMALFLAGSAVLLAASLDILRRQRALFTLTIALGAACWVAGNVLWLAGWAVAEVVPWWLSFLILTIAGERLELSRFMPPSPMATRVFALVLAVLVAGLVGARHEGGITLYGVGLLALAAWLAKQDVARRTVHSRGLTRYIALCLLSGYAWLAVGGATLLTAGALQPGSAAYDAVLHALALGFVFSMVFGHAPIIFPAVLRVAVPYHRSFYLPLLLLHGSVAVRIAGDASGRFDWLRWGALLNALALLAFIVFTAAAVHRGRHMQGRPSAAASRRDH